MWTRVKYGRDIRNERVNEGRSRNSVRRGKGLWKKQQHSLRILSWKNSIKLT